MLQAIDHINIVVHDLDVMTYFYHNTLGLKLTKQVTITGEWVQRTVGLANVIAHVKYLQCDQGTRLELIKYESPKSESISKADQLKLDQANMVGLRHLAFRVDNLEAIYQKLSDMKVQFISKPQQVPVSQVTYADDVRKKLVYFHDPEGNILELCQYQKSKP